MDTNSPLDKTPDSLDTLPDAVAAAAFRRLVRHLRHRHDAQNIDLMGLAGFCRNCLSRWYREAAEGMGIPLTNEYARSSIYGMPYIEWQAKYQTPASPEALTKFKDSSGH